MKPMYVLGVMSGTSLDGLDLALVHLFEERGRIRYEMVESIAYTYPSSVIRRLDEALSMDKTSFSRLERDYSLVLAQFIADCIAGLPIVPDIISSHGHTIYHQPEEGITVQIGDGQIIADHCGIPVVSDFRTPDVRLGGQGAPLVPIGDKMLFGAYTYCLNLGGIANISYEKNGVRLAYDICPCNLVLNHFSQRKDKPYDSEGTMAASGRILPQWMNKWTQLAYYQLPGPKSLGREWVEEHFFQNTYSDSSEDLLRTAVEHIAMEIGRSLLEEDSTVLITGGGAFNSFLISRIQAHTHASLILPERQLIEFKEALIFALLGYLRWNNRTNVLASVTGARHDHIAGTISYPKNRMK